MHNMYGKKAYMEESMEESIPIDPDEGVLCTVVPVTPKIRHPNQKSTIAHSTIAIATIAIAHLTQAR